MNYYTLIFSLIWCMAASLSASDKFQREADKLIRKTDSFEPNIFDWFTKSCMQEWLLLARNCEKNSFSMIPAEVQGRIFSPIDPLQSSRAWKQDNPVLLERWRIPAEVTFIAAENHLILFATLGEIRDTPDKIDWSMLQEGSVDEVDFAYIKEHEDTRLYYVYSINGKTFKKSSKMVKLENEMPASYGNQLTGEVNYKPKLLRTSDIYWHKYYNRTMSFSYTSKSYQTYGYDMSCRSEKKTVPLINPYTFTAGASAEDCRFITVLNNATLKFKEKGSRYLCEDFQIFMHDKKQLILKENARNHEYYCQLKMQDPAYVQPNTYKEYAIPKLSSCMGYYNQLPSDDDNRFIAVKKEPSNNVHSVIEVYIPASKVCMQHYCVYQAYIIAQNLAGSDKNIWKPFRLPMFERLIQETAELYDCMEAFKKVRIIKND